MPSGQRIVYLTDPHGLQQCPVKAAIPDIQQRRTGNIRGFGPCLAGKPEANIILDGKDISDIGVNLRAVLFYPPQQRRLLTGHDLLTDLRVYPTMGIILIPLLNNFPCPVIRGADPLISGLIIISPEIQSLSVPADGNSQNIFRGNG